MIMIKHLDSYPDGHDETACRTLRSSSPTNGL